MSSDSLAVDGSNSPAKGNHSKRSRSGEEEEYLAFCLVDLRCRPIENFDKPVAAVIPTVDEAPDLEPTNIKQAIIRERSEENSDDNFKCRVCGKRFLTHHVLNGHKIIHHQNKSIIINSRREENNINIVKTHVCLICGEFFPNGQSLDGHMRCHYRRPILRRSRKKYQEFDLNILPAAEPEPTEPETELNLELKL